MQVSNFEVKRMFLYCHLQQKLTIYSSFWMGKLQSVPVLMLTLKNKVEKTYCL